MYSSRKGKSGSSKPFISEPSAWSNTVLAENDLGGSYPEDLMNLMRQAVGIIDHLTTNHRDIHNKRSLELTEAKIRRLGNYYKAEGKLPADWKYKRDQLRLIVE
jgi:small subunit ribosomal protein S15